MLIADDSVNTDFFTVACTLEFAGLMLDTEPKCAGTRFGQPRLTALRAITARHDCPLGLAGALRHDDLAELADLDPDFAGLRTAVCDRDRTGQLDPCRVRGLREELRRLTAPHQGCSLSTGSHVL